MRYLIILILGILSPFLSEAKSNNLPNILLFHADDMTWRDCQPYGNKDVLTPQIAKLAEEGMCFDNMHTSTAMCAPTRMQLYTGIFPVRNGAYPNHSMVYSGVKSLVHHFNDLDYRVAMVGKTHHEPFKSFPFEYLGGRHGDNGEGVEIDIDRIKPILNQKKPFFMVVSSNQPHSPWNRGDENEYNKDEIEVPEYLIDCKNTREELVKYYAEITYTDSLLAVCLDYLEEAGKTENTIVIFTSEQGSWFPFAKWTCYDLGLKTAFIIKWPGKIQPNSRNNVLAQYVDIVPTLLEAAGVNPEKINVGIKDSNGGKGFDGKSFYKTLTGESSQHREYVYGIHTTRGIYSGSQCYPIRSVRNKKYKYILNLNSSSEFSNMITVKKGGYYQVWLEETKDDEERHNYVTKYVKRPKEELYNIIDDPYELNNLSELPNLEKVKKELRKELLAWMSQQEDKGIETELNALNRQPSRKNNSWKGLEQTTNIKILNSK
jgi:uncharacterized sulfatase